MSSPTIQRRAPTGISVLISGAGIGGLSAALEFWRRGCEVRIFERTPTTVTAGDSFVIQPSALQWIKHWPEMKEPHDKISFEPMFAKYKQTGERVSDPVVMGELFKTKGSDKHPRLLLHSRPRFHTVLLDQVARCGMQVEFGKEVVEFFEVSATAKGGVKLSNGSEYEADLVIAADGLRGASSNLVSGKPVPATSSKYACLRSSYPIELAFKDPKVAEHFKFQADGSSIYQSWAGANKFGVFWCSDAEIMWILTYPDGGSAKESWNNRITTEDALKFTSSIPGWSEVYDSVIRATPPNAIVDWKLMWRDPQPKWTSPAGYVVQLGDAAHSFLPTSGNGGTQAMEDAVSLSVCVVKAGKDRIPDATRVHNLLRFERVSFIQAMGIARRDAKAKADTAKMSSANWKAEIKAMPGSWLMEHDPEEYAEKNFEPALAHLVEGAPFKNTNRPTKVEYQPWTIDGLTEALAKGEPSILDGDWS